MDYWFCMQFYSKHFNQRAFFSFFFSTPWWKILMCVLFHSLLGPNTVWWMRLISVGSSPHPEGIWVLITSSPSTMHASHCLYRLGWIQWCVTQDIVADCLLVTKPPVGSGPLCITPSLGYYYYSWEKTLQDIVLMPTHLPRLLDRQRHSSLANAGKNCWGQQTDSKKAPGVLSDLLMFPADQSTGEQDRCQGPRPLVSVWICWDLLKCERSM